MFSYFSLRLPKELKNKLSSIAKSRGVSLNGLIVSILWKCDEF